MVKKPIIIDADNAKEWLARKGWEPVDNLKCVWRNPRISKLQEKEFGNIHTLDAAVEIQMLAERYL